MENSNYESFHEDKELDPEGEIQMIVHEVSLQGANDFEIPRLNNILKELKEGKLDPQKAVREARAIREGKMDYH